MKWGHEPWQPRGFYAALILLIVATAILFAEPLGAWLGDLLWRWAPTLALAGAIGGIVAVVLHAERN